MPCLISTGKHTLISYSPYFGIAVFSTLAFKKATSGLNVPAIFKFQNVH
jgi:hypothetical protein